MNLLNSVVKAQTFMAMMADAFIALFPIAVLLNVKNRIRRRLFQLESHSNPNRFETKEQFLLFSRFFPTQLWIFLFFPPFVS